MKRASIYGVLAAVFLVAILFTSADAIIGYDIPNYTYDSDIDPKAIEKWNVVLMDSYEQYLLITYKNPLITEKISAAIILSKFPGIRVAFAYYKNYETHLFVYHRDTHHYAREQDQKWSEFTELMKKTFQAMLGHVGV